ncbi:ubiquinol-cytochrome C chaperone family protein [Hyphomonas sp.]|uniref:ubiquinol-cytochrome C chaperone family protein n=1 Tax=Hyphomonas sp. TaxID=87 RepID=UPI003528256C
MVGIWNPFLKAKAQRQRAEKLYRGLMAAALSPEAYALGVVPDDLDHRVQMVSLHAAVLVWQLTQRPEEELQRLPQLVHAKVFDGFDASLRETGVGDASIARKVRKMGEHYYGLGTSIADALSCSIGERAVEIEDVLRRNGVAAAGREPDLAQHLVAIASVFDATASEAFLSGTAPWPTFPATSRPGVAKV